jgi:CheY-like chemotaxis protein
VLSPEVLNVNDVVVAVENLLRRTLNENVHLETGLANQIGLVEIDRAQLEQVLINLAVNAQDAMPKGGRLKIETRTVDEMPSEPRVRVHARNWIVLCIEDTGTGIKPDLQQSIFEPFFTTKEREKGTGLGLATVKAIIERARGFVQVESKTGEGTRFLVYLPVSTKQRVATASQRPRAAIGAANGERILVVDDDDALRRAACRMLVKAGYEPLEARSGSEALNVCQSNPNIALVLTDMVMPNMTGMELTQALCATRPEIRVVYMTGYAVPDTPGGARGSGHRIVPKPFRERRLLKVVHDALHDDAAGTQGQAKLG